MCSNVLKGEGGCVGGGKEELMATYKGLLWIPVVNIAMKVCTGLRQGGG